MASIDYLVSLKKSVRWMLLSLTAEFVLGMLVNLFAVPPDDPGYITEPIFVKILFPLHGINGIILVILAIFILFLVIKLGRKNLKKFAIYGLISILIAALGGIATITLKENASEIASFIMSLGFIAALLSFGKLHFFLKE